MIISKYRLHVYISHRLIYNIRPLIYLNPFIYSYVVHISRMYDLLAFLLINVSNVCYLRYSGQWVRDSARRSFFLRTMDVDIVR